MFFWLSGKDFCLSGGHILTSDMTGQIVCMDSLLEYNGFHRNTVQLLGVRILLSGKLFNQ